MGNLILPELPTHGETVLARVGPSHKDAGSGIDDDALIATPCIYSRSNMVAFLGEFGPHGKAERRLEQYFLTGMPEPGRLARFLYIHSEINPIDQNLHVALRLVVTPHDAKGPDGLSTLQHHPWNQSM